MIAVIDYGAGNLFSVKNALEYLGMENIITADKDEISRADSMILPGVGAFPNAMKMLKNTGLDRVIKEEVSKKPLLGICLGMQLLFDSSSEFAETKGLSLIPGRVDFIKTSKKIPHMGYNELEYNNPSFLLTGVSEGSCVYFVHSYMAYTIPEYVAAYVDYDIKIPALVQNRNVFGAQFHPEKSGEPGLAILKNFGGLTK